jgi:hypothetical protein
MDLGRMNSRVSSLGFLVGQQRPFVSFLVKHWYLAAFAGLAMYGKVKERHKKGDLTSYNTMADLGLILSPLVGLALLNQLAEQHSVRQQMLAANVTPAIEPNPTTGMPVPAPM